MYMGLVGLAYAAVVDSWWNYWFW